jgi:hypothetical protein
MSPTQLVAGQGGDVLLLSMRKMATLVAYCAQYEFENVIADVTGADRVDVVDDNNALEWSRRLYRYTRAIRPRGGSPGKLPGFHQQVELKRDYELFFPVFNHPHELFALASVRDWRKHCRFAACYIGEMWLHTLPAYLLEMLSSFDHIFLGVINPVERAQQLLGRPCSYLPLATDVLEFAPPPGLAERPIDFCNIGSRSGVTHEALLQLARDRGFFYYYDTVAASGTDLKQTTFRVRDPREHRLLLASLMQRSRFAFAHRAFINNVKLSAGVHEISGRAYEAGAAGVVMLGEAPACEEFKQQFDWPDAVIPVPFDCPGIGRVLKELSMQPARLARIRQNNVHNCALRHDWVHRLRTVFETLQILPTERMLKREQALRTIAEEAMAGAAPLELPAASSM